MFVPVDGCAGRVQNGLHGGHLIEPGASALNQRDT